MSRPSFPFYPDNYMNDAGVRRCSAASRGVWIDLLCLMHQGSPYGHLAGAGGAHPKKFLASWCGESGKSFDRALVELGINGVYSLTDSGTIFSRRMVRDESNRIVRGAGGKLSLGNPNVPRPKDTFMVGVEGYLTSGDDEGKKVLLKDPSLENRGVLFALLSEYPGAKTLPGKPDEVIVNRCLALAHGDVDELARAFRALHLSGKKPDRSWAWFPKVLPQYLENRK